jgi:hypothetical protein
MKLISQIFIVVYSSFLFSQKKDTIVLNIKIEKFKKEAFDNFEIYYKNTLEKDTIIKESEGALELLTYHNPIKDSLSLINIPIIDLCNGFKKNNYFSLFNFKCSENQIVFIKNKKNQIVSEFNSYKDISNITKYEYLTFAENYVDYIGAKRTEYSIYNFKNSNFYFFLNNFNGLFEIEKGKLFVVFVFCNCIRDENGISSIDELKLNGLKNPECIQIIKIEFNIYMNKILTKKELNSFFETGKLNKKFYKKNIKKLKRLSKKNNDTYEIKIID